MLFLCCVLLACESIHDEPEGEGMNPNRVTVYIDFSFTETTLNPIPHTASRSSAIKINPFDDHQLRYIVEIYPESGGSVPVHRFVKYSNQLKDYEVSHTVTLNASSYTVLAWVDYVPQNTTADYLYNTQSLKSVTLKAPYIGSAHAKDAFSAKTQLSLKTHDGGESSYARKTIELKRPLSSFVIIATDMDEYLLEQGGGLADADIPVSTQLTYLPSLAISYDVGGNKCQYSDKEEYLGTVIDHTEESCIVAYDYVLMDSESTNVEISFDIHSLNGVLINRIENLKIPLRRNSQTIVRLPCLIPSSGNGGIDINDGFDDFLDVPIPD